MSPRFRMQMMTVQTIRGNRATHEMRGDSVFVTNAHILYHFIAKMSIVFPFRSSGAAAAQAQKAVLLSSVMPRDARFYQPHHCRPAVAKKQKEARERTILSRAGSYDCMKTLHALFTPAW